MTTALASPAPEAIDVALCAPAGPVSPEGWIAHRLHALDRDWPETNCELDHWIELAAFNGLEPEAMLGFTVAQDYLGDQFTLLVPPKEDLRRLYGASADMYALYGHFEDQIVARTAAGGVIALDTDAFYLPDSFGVSYRRRHVKTTIAIQAVRPQERSLDYFHNLGFWRLEGEDYDMVVFRPPHLQIDDIIPPYAELIRFERDPMRGAGLRAATIDVLRTHLTRAEARSDPRIRRDSRGSRRRPRRGGRTRVPRLGVPYAAPARRKSRIAGRTSRMARRRLRRCAEGVQGGFVAGQDAAVPDGAGRRAEQGARRRCAAGGDFARPHGGAGCRRSRPRRAYLALKQSD